jgi:hypothetical protein
MRQPGCQRRRDSSDGAHDRRKRARAAPEQTNALAPRRVRPRDGRAQAGRMRAVSPSCHSAFKRKLAVPRAGEPRRRATRAAAAARSEPRRARRARERRAARSVAARKV